MKISELTAMTVAELKALAKKKKVVLSAGGKKADIISAIIAVAKSVKTAGKKAAVSIKAAKPAVKAGKKILAKSTTARKPASKRRAPARTSPEVTTPVREWKLPPGAE